MYAIHIPIRWNTVVIKRHKRKAADSLVIFVFKTIYKIMESEAFIG